MSHPAVVGACADWEFDLVELLDGELSGERARAVNAHLGGCARCASWAGRLAGMNAVLGATLPRPAPSPDFDARLAARIAALDGRDRGALRAAAERDYLSTLDGLRQGFSLRGLGNSIGAAALALGGLWLAQGSLLNWLQGYAELTPLLHNDAALGFAALCALAAAALVPALVPGSRFRS